MILLILGGCGGSPREEAAIDPRPKEDLSPWYSGMRPKRAPPARVRASDDSGRPVVLGDVDAAAIAEGRSRSETSDMWSIVIVGFKGDNGAMLAEQALARVQLAGLESAYRDKRDSTWVVAYGGYKDPGSAEARADLEAVRSTVVDGDRPFTGAMMAPPATTLIGSMPEFDLSLVRKRSGGQRAKYTLQIAQYCKPDRTAPTDAELAEFRKAAEEACVRLRREGEEAYFHHGPRMSAVTIGLFTEADYVTTAPHTKEVGAIVISRKPVESELLRGARERFPYNLINGQAAKVRSHAAAEGRMVPSVVVTVPD
ncbi:MAG: hypothetical protein ACOYN0_05165 [Phycisphaerales bacterium]